MPRPRAPKNRDLPTGLYRDAKGYYMVHPVTRVKTRVGSNKQIAFDVHAQVWPQWKNDAASVRAASMMQRIEVASTPERREMAAEFLERFRDDVLPSLTKRDGSPMSDTTRYDYHRMLTRTAEVDVMQSTPLLRINAQGVRKALSPWLEKKHYYNYVCAALSRAFSYAVAEGALATNPLKDVDRQHPPRRKQLISPREYASITAQMEPWLADVCDLLYLTSGRPGDILGLRDDMDITEGKDGTLVRFTIHKTDQPIEIEDNGEIEKVVKRLRARKREWRIVHPLLIVRIGRRRILPVAVEYVSRRFAAAIVDAGLPKGAYQLRDIRPTALTAEAEMAGKATDKGGHLTEQMKRHYVRRKIPMRVRNNLLAPRKLAGDDGGT